MPNSASGALVDGDGFEPPLFPWDPALQAGAFDRSANHPKKLHKKSPGTLQCNPGFGVFRLKT
jgi:hypothetical protein